MKTIQRTIASSFFTLITYAAFAQVNLGLQSTTQAALNATVGTNSIMQTTNALTMSTTSALKANTTNAINSGKQLSTAIDEKARQVSTKASNVAASDFNAGAGLNSTVSTATDIQSQAGVNGINASSFSGSSLEANGNLRSTLTSTVENSGLPATTSAIKENTNANVQTAKTIIANTGSQLKADAKSIKEAAASAQPSVKTSVETGAKADSKTNIQQ